MMDVEKLIHCLQCCSKVDAHNIGCDDCGLEYCGPECQQLCGTAATALSTLQAENEKLRAEVESLKKGHCAGCSIPAVKAEQIRDLTDAPKLRAELEKVKRERDAAIKDIWVPKWISCKNGENCNFVSAITGMPDCAGCDNWEWRGPKEE